MPLWTRLSVVLVAVAEAPNRGLLLVLAATPTRYGGGGGGGGSQISNAALFGSWWDWCWRHRGCDRVVRVSDA